MTPPLVEVATALHRADAERAGVAVSPQFFELPRAVRDTYFRAAHRALAACSAWADSRARYVAEEGASEDVAATDGFAEAAPEDQVAMVESARLSARVAIRRYLEALETSR